MKLGKRVWCGLAISAGSMVALAQSVISAHSGLIHYVEGQVYLGDQQVESKFGNFPEVKENQQLRTAEGRAEVLLTPGVFLRLGENSSFRMITNRLIDTRLELLSGEAIVEADDIPKDNSVTVVCHDAAVHFAKKGIYQFEAKAGEMRVYDGEAEVTAGDQTIQIKEGRSITLDTLAMNKFDKNDSDALNRWSARRAQYVSMANVSAAQSLSTSGGLYSGGFASGWYYNPFFGMYTFVPGLDGSWYSPYGYRFFSPWDVYTAYMPYYYYTPTGRGGSSSSGSGYNNAVGNKTVPVRIPNPNRGGGSGMRPASMPVGRGGFGSYSGTATTTAPVARSGGGGASSGSHR